MSIAQSFDNYWANTLGNFLTDNISRNNAQNIKVFEQCILRNSNPSKTTKHKKYIIPSATGTGKTQISGFYIANTIEKGFKTLVVVERTDSADELKGLILKIAGESCASAINTFHSKPSASVKSISDAMLSQVLIVTHSRFNDVLLNQEEDSWGETKYQKLVSDRDLIIIDEAISTVEEISISKDRLNILVAELKNQSTLVEKKQKNAFMEEVRIIDTIASDLTRHYDNPELKTDIMPYDKLINEPTPSKEVMPLVFKIASQHNKLILEKLTYIFNSDIQYLYKHGSDISIKVVKEILPDKSVVVLDATATINEVYKQYEKHNKNLQIIPKIECRTYDGVTIHTATTSTGKESILSNKDRIIKSIVASVRELTTSSDKVLIVVHKDIEMSLVSYLGDCDYIHINHWGNLTGTNDYRDCNKIFIYGLFHKPLYTHYNNYRLSGNPFKTSMLVDEFERIAVRQIAISDITSELIQAINRICIRKVIDSKGGCAKADVYVTLPSHDSSYIMRAFESELPNATVLNDWKLPDDILSVDRKGNTQALIDVLNVLKDDGQLIVTRKEVRNLIDDSSDYSSIFRANLNKDSTKAILRVAGFQLCKVPKRDNRGRLKNTPGFKYVGS